MDTEDENASYLAYLNDSENQNNYLLDSNGVNTGIGDTFSVGPIFTEIESTDWPTEGLSVLLNNSLIEENEAASSQEDNVEGTSQVAEESEDSPMEVLEEIVPELENGVDEVNIPELPVFNGDNDKTYINYSPIVKENPDGNKEIYLTEKDINNSASIIQLLNTDGSIISIDKSILSTLNLPQQQVKNLSDFYTNVTAKKCNLCGFLCESEKDMKEHLTTNHSDKVMDNKIELVPVQEKKMVSLLNKSRTKNGETKKEYTVFVCSICKDVCSTTEEIQEHMISKHKLIKKDELDPEKKTETKKDTGDGAIQDKKKVTTSILDMSKLLFKKQQKAMKKLKCQMQGCIQKFGKTEHRDLHERCHIGENIKSFICFECKEKFSIWRICSSHLWKVHKIDAGLLTCHICNQFKSNSPGQVLNHMRIHSEEKPFVCSTCGLAFRQLAQLKNHEAIHKPPDELPSWSVEKQCTICDRFFANSKCLKKHIQSVHENFKPFICQICGHKTSRKAMLELHLRQHTGIKPHACPYCEYRTGDHNCLRRHIMKHIGVHKYKCPHCNYSCIQSVALKGHIIHKHPGKSGTFSCKYCSFTTINYTVWAAHEKCHEAKANETSVQSSNVETSQVNAEDDETQSCFLNMDHGTEETVDTGGITIPAGFELKLIS